MNKIAFDIGLLSFFISIIIFSSQKLSIIDILLRSFSIFAVVTIMVSVLILTVVKSINKLALEKQKDVTDNLIGSAKNE
ncbi:MAG TPA: hypothetical protein VHP30_08045 [Ignavibacteriales bacterium]|jgi:uncharacterized membrane protein YhhN|nr:hypothetical protein [Ignavibacteriales bacterium]